MAEATPSARPMAVAAPRARLYELDMIRALVALAVVGVHVAAFTVILTHGTLGVQVQNAVVSALHFTREVFLAITAFVLVYGYAGRPFPARTFWRKRGLGVFLPYAAWSVFYAWMTTPHQPFGTWLLGAGLDILDGNASYQLYYILLTLEFYLILPWFLRFITRAATRPWRLFAASFTIQLALMVLDYRLVQAGPFAQTGLGQFINTYQNRLLPLYQFYLVMGALGAIYRWQIQAFVRGHGAVVLGGLALGLALLWGNLVVQVDVLHQSVGYGITVFQPAMAFYALAAATFLYWRASAWAAARAPGRPRAYPFWELLSNVSFGIYLIHPYLLGGVMRHVVPVLPVAWPEPLRVIIVWLLVAGGAVAVSTVFMYMPGLSRLVGRGSAWRPESVPARWLARIRAEASWTFASVSHHVRHLGSHTTTPDAGAHGSSKLHSRQARSSR